MNGWISVKDATPGHGRVLVKTKECGMMVASMCIPNSRPDQWTWGVVNDIELEQEQVTHWMFLPDPPAE